MYLDIFMDVKMSIWVVTETMLSTSFWNSRTSLV